MIVSCFLHRSREMSAFDYNSTQTSRDNRDIGKYSRASRSILTRATFGKLTARASRSLASTRSSSPEPKRRPRRCEEKAAPLFGTRFRKFRLIGQTREQIVHRDRRVFLPIDRSIILEWRECGRAAPVRIFWLISPPAELSLLPSLPLSLSLSLSLSLDKLRALSFSWRERPLTITIRYFEQASEKQPRRFSRPVPRNNPQCDLRFELAVISRRYSAKSFKIFRGNAIAREDNSEETQSAL